VTTPYGSRAEGFWNDAGVSSHTVRSVHSQEWALLTDSCIEWHIKRWVTRAFTQGSLPWNRQTLFSCSCAKNEYKVPFFLEGTKVEMVVPPAGGAASIFMSKAKGFTPRFGKNIYRYPLYFDSTHCNCST
jgi:hypothetical protein